MWCVHFVWQENPYGTGRALHVVAALYVVCALRLARNPYGTGRALHVVAALSVTHALCGFRAKAVIFQDGRRLGGL